MFFALLIGTALAAAPPIDDSTLPASAIVKKIGEDGKPHPVIARLLSDSTMVTPGSTFRLGVALEQLDGWHTYWKSPGQIGLPTDITWTLPDGFTATPYQYPIPERFFQQDLTSFGYEHEVLLFSTLTVPADAPLGKQELRAQVQWLVCQTQCIPGEAELLLPIEVGPAATPSAFVSTFDSTGQHHPVNAEKAGLIVKGGLIGDGIVKNSKFTAIYDITSTNGPLQPHQGPIPWPTFTPIVGFDWMVNSLNVENTEGGVKVTLEGETFEPEELPTDAKVGGLVQVQVGDTWIHTEVLTPLPWKGAPTAVPAPEPKPKSVMPAEADSPTQAGGVGLIDGLLLGLMAFVGGLVLNVMPCVLPVLLLKLYGLVEQQTATASERRTAGAAFFGGVLCSFWAMATIIIVIRLVTGQQVSWGEQFQYPQFVAFLTTVVFAFGLSLFGVFEVPAFGVETASEASSREGPVGYFMSGVFATLLATPCSAPFLAPALAFALAAPPLLLFTIFTIVGIGLGGPFLVITLIPQLYKLLPAPGAWMEWFKQFLGFTLMATTLWLIGTLVEQIGVDRTFWFIAFLIVVWFACWFFGKYAGLAASGRDQLVGLGVGGAAMVLGGFYFLDMEFAKEETQCAPVVVATELDYSSEVPWQKFSDATVDKLAGNVIFIDFTATWCLSCKANEKAILSLASVRDAMKQHKVVPLKADWTRKNPEITAWLKRFNKPGVPFYLVIPKNPGEAPIPLPEVLTPTMVTDALAKGAGLN